MIGVDIGGTNLLVGRIENNKVVERAHEHVVDGCVVKAFIAAQIVQKRGKEGIAFEFVWVWIIGTRNRFHHFCANAGHFA